MNHETYRDLYIRDLFSVFEFFSIGPKGLILKKIVFSPTEYPDVHSLTFGDIDIEGEINDYSVSNNGDRNKILSTVAYAIDIYLNEYPDRYIYFTGSTEQRTRLYRIAISLNLDWLYTKWMIFCQNGNDFEPFERNKEAQGFLIKKKS